MVYTTHTDMIARDISTDTVGGHSGRDGGDIDELTSRSPPQICGRTSKASLASPEPEGLRDERGTALRVETLLRRRPLLQLSGPVTTLVATNSRDSGPGPVRRRPVFRRGNSSPHPPSREYPAQKALPEDASRRVGVRVDGPVRMCKAALRGSVRGYLG